MEQLKAFLAALPSPRKWALALVAIVLLWNSPNIPVVLFALGVTAAFAIAAHYITQVLLEGHNLLDLYNQASSTPLGAAIVFAAVTFFLSVSFYATLTFLK